MKRTGIALLAVTTVLAAFLAVNEWIVRTVSGDTILLFPRYHTDARYGDFTIRRLRPNIEFKHTSVDGSWTFSINDRGLRNDRDHDYAKPADTIRVLSLGDSQAQGYESDQDKTYSAVIEQVLTEKGYAVEVINAGISGFSNAESLIYLENEGVKYQPDFVVLGFSFTDPQDNLKADMFRLDDEGELFVNSHEYIPGVRIQNFIYSFPLVKWLGENSYLYSVVFNGVWDFFKNRLGQLATARVSEIETAAVVSEDREVAERTPEPDYGEFGDYRTALTAALLQRIHDFSAENDMKFILIDLPALTADDGMESSLPTRLQGSASSYADTFISSRDLLAEHSGREHIFVPHGARHISSFTHRQLGLAVARSIEDSLQQKLHRGQSL